MFEVHAVDAANRGAYSDVLEAHFRIRHDIYVGERGWLDLERPDGREVDAFDTEDAVYLLGLTADRQVVAGSRLVPSLKPHLMSEVFPQLAPGGVPRATDIFEWTRIFVVPAFRTPGRPCPAAGAIYCGILEYCLGAKIRQLSIVCEEYWFDRLDRFGWNPKKLGPPLSHQSSLIIGLTVDMTPDALATTRAAYGIKGAVLTYCAGSSFR